jgi:predicted nucleic acid-binding protein
MRIIADSGFLIALLDRLDGFHAWAARIVEVEPPPYRVCEAVCAEVAAVLGSPEPMLAMLDRGDLQLDFSLSEELLSVHKLTRKYKDQPMDLADACVVRMSEIHRICKILTVDERDFSVYRRFGNQPLPCIFPDS